MHNPVTKQLQQWLHELSRSLEASAVRGGRDLRTEKWKNLPWESLSQDKSNVKQK